MAGRRHHKRVLIYSHDSFGLGHLRRCRAIAHAMVDDDPGVSVLILSGSPIIGSFDFRARVDFVRVPGVIKLRNGEYVSLNLHIDIEETLAMRSSIIRHTADIFDPDLLIIDKEPLGLRGEVRDTLQLVQRRRAAVILGLRDVMDDPEALESEWERKNAVPALSEYYDEIWVYGLPQICDPLAGLPVPPSVRRRMIYTGYLRRNAADLAVTPDLQDLVDGSFLLVTPGGGGDGDALVDLVLSAYEHDDALPFAALIVFGPFMVPEQRAAFAARAAQLKNVRAVTFNARLEALMARAAGVVAMGGYNTFCEILSFDKPALIVPRTAPRLEQFIRTERAAELGLVAMLSEQQGRDPRAMAAALRRLPSQPAPSSVVIPGLLDGVPNVNRLARKWLDRGRAGRVAVRARIGA
ncbi:MAG TPA: glycosyltransferase [Stellaceae bacterium]|nr:glycosyltransferase [Stellaceae bacterium]